MRVLLRKFTAISLTIIAVCFQPGVGFASSNFDLNSVINDTPLYDPTTYGCNGGPGAGAPTLSGTDNLQKAFNYLSGNLAQKGAKLPAMEASAIIGNMEQESGQGLNPLAVNPTSGAFGIAQWLGDRLTPLQAMPNYKTIDVQLTYLWTKDIPGQIAFHPLETIAKDTTIQQMTFDWENTFERAGEHMGDAPMNNRINNAIAVLAKFGNAAGPAPGSAPGGACSTDSAVDCTATGPAPGNISPLRAKIVCLAKGELALWKSKPGYPNTPYAAVGLLKYTNGWYEEWCADFTSWVLHSAGDPFSGGRNSWDVPAVSSIQTQGGKFKFHPGPGYSPHPGDIAIHGGAHVNIYVGSSAGSSEYIGGDQGNGPYGANPPTQTPPNPPSGSNVSTELETGYYGGGITGYVTPE